MTKGARLSTWCTTRAGRTRKSSIFFLCISVCLRDCGHRHRYGVKGGPTCLCFYIHDGNFLVTTPLFSICPFL